jgi:glycosyltransferase involved in cell wall biosynthesis
MKVSVITVTFNSAATVEDTLLSVERQSHADIEHVVVDGGSTDGTLEIIGRHREHIAKLITGPDHGIYDALNKGIAAATGEVIGILHSDDIYADKEVVADYVSVFKKENCAAVYADLHYVDRRDPGRIIRRWKSGRYSRKAFLNGWMPPHPTFFVRREAFARYGNFSTELRTAADYELMLRFLFRHNISVGYLPRCTVKMRAGGASNVSLRARINANLEDRMAWKMNGLRPRFYTLFLKPLRKIFQFLT